MIGRNFSLAALALAIGLPIASPARPESADPAIRWELDRSGQATAVSVVGLSPETRKALDDPNWTPERKAALLSVAIEAGGKKPPDRPSMLGTYRVEGETFRFTPRYPFDRGRTYTAIFRPSLLPGGSGPEVRSSHLVRKVATSKTTVTRVTPSDRRVPENLLKFYLHFSRPMSRGEVYDRVRLLKDDGRAVDLPFLRLAEELWDPTGTRLTLLIDPGRIKRGLKPREESGPVLEAGRDYTLVIDAGWPDAEGGPLASPFLAKFRAEVADETQPDPKNWQVHSPVASTRDPLAVTFPEPLDGALIEDCLAVVNARGEAVEGRIEIGALETLWEFTPAHPWTSGDYQLIVDADLEDQAGNSILRRFEVDVQRDTPSRPEARQVKIPITIRPRAR